MAKVKRQIIKIDEEKCNGCGLCVPSCKEGALQIINGKAKLVSDVYCDGLGACLGDCPQGALTIEEREAEEFDMSFRPTEQSEGVEESLAVKKQGIPRLHPSGSARDDRESAPLPFGCPGTMAKSIDRKSASKSQAGDQQSELSQWPIQLTLVPVNAPYLKEADLVLLADCTAVAYANLHRDFIKGKVIVMACPKLDETDPYIEKLAAMMKANNFKSVEVVMMEVPCCSGLSGIAEQARKQAGVEKDIKKTIVSIEGERRSI